MKKILVCISGFVMIFTIFGCHQVKSQIEKMEHSDNEKIEDVRGILDKILEHIADDNPELSFEDGNCWILN